MCAVFGYSIFINTKLYTVHYSSLGGSIIRKEQYTGNTQTEGRSNASGTEVSVSLPPISGRVTGVTLPVCESLSAFSSQLQLFQFIVM